MYLFIEKDTDKAYIFNNNFCNFSRSNIKQLDAKKELQNKELQKKID